MKSFANGNSGPSHSLGNGNGCVNGAQQGIHSAHWYEFVEGNIHPV